MMTIVSRNDHTELFSIHCRVQVASNADERESAEVTALGEILCEGLGEALQVHVAHVDIRVLGQ